MNDEKLRILEMIQAGKVTAAEGMELLNAIFESDATEQTLSSPNLSSRFLKVRVDNVNSKVNVNVPLNLLKAASKFISMGMGFIPEEARLEMEKKGIDLTKFDFEELVSLIDDGLIDGKLVDIDTYDEKEGTTKVEVYVE